MTENEYIPYPAYGMPQRTYFPQPYVQQPLQGGIACRLVSSRDEAATAQVPFDGKPYVFLNLSGGEVYAKQFNCNTGSTDFISFARVNSTAAPAPAYATLEDIEVLRAELAQLKKPQRRREAIDE